jgi:hypothetical protein
MDGSSTFTPVVTLGDVVETVMRHRLPFAKLRQLVYEWMRERKHFFISADRVGENGVYIISITYWDAEGVKQAESFDEWPSYTQAQPVCCW